MNSRNKKEIPHREDSVLHFNNRNSKHFNQINKKLSEKRGINIENIKKFSRSLYENSQKITTRKDPEIQEFQNNDKYKRQRLIKNPKFQNLIEMIDPNLLAMNSNNIIDKKIIDNVSNKKSLTNCKKKFKFPNSTEKTNKFRILSEEIKSIYFESKSNNKKINVKEIESLNYNYVESVVKNVKTTESDKYSQLNRFIFAKNSATNGLNLLYPEKNSINRGRYSNSNPDLKLNGEHFENNYNKNNNFSNTFLSRDLLSKETKGK